MKILYSIFFILISSYGHAQDTIVFKSGDIKAVQIVEIDESNGLIGYVFEAETTYVSMSLVHRYMLHSELNENDASFEGSISSNPSKARRTYKRSKFRTPSKYDYSPFSLGVNLLSPLSGLRNTSSIASNYSIGIYAEYLFVEKFALRAPIRIGLGLYELNNSSYYYNNQNELLFEFGIEPVYYVHGQNRMSFYLKPGLHFGMNQGINETYYVDYYYYAGDPNDNYPYDNYAEILPAFGWFYRASFDVGVQFNAFKNLSIGLELGGFIGNVRHYESNSYANTKLNPEYFLDYSYGGRRNRPGFQGAINLTYRFGGKLKETEE